MKNFRGAILIFLIILTIPSVFAIYGGETISYNFTNCNLLTANITNASLGEWILSPNCNEDNAGNFTCNCSNNYTLNLTPKANSIGTFGILITDYYSVSTTTSTTISITSNGYLWTSCKPEYYTCSQFQKCCSNLACENNICIPSSTSIIITPTQTSTSTTTSVIIPQKQPDITLILFATLISIIIIFLVWYYHRHKNT